jgi:TetR/AcrR family transcriptional repressor of lmrAB and yxaGH operons
MIRTMATLLRRQGYAATGWRQVIAESGAPWGSQAHHFPGGKQQLAAEAVAIAGSAYERMLRAALGSSHPADAVLAWADLAASQLEASGWVDGCPVATVTLEEAASSETLAAACAIALTGWRDALTEAITAHGAAAPEAASLATLVLAGIEGGLLLSRATRDPGPLRTVGSELATALRARLQPVPASSCDTSAAAASRSRS